MNLPERYWDTAAQRWVYPGESLEMLRLLKTKLGVKVEVSLDGFDFINGASELTLTEDQVLALSEELRAIVTTYGGLKCGTQL
jgi:hypothetical protein